MSPTITMQYVDSNITFDEIFSVVCDTLEKVYHMQAFYPIVVAISTFSLPASHIISSFNQVSSLKTVTMNLVTW